MVFPKNRHGSILAITSCVSSPSALFGGVRIFHDPVARGFCPSAAWGAASWGCQELRVQVRNSNISSFFSYLYRNTDLAPPRLPPGWWQFPNATTDFLSDFVVTTLPRVRCGIIQATTDFLRRLLRQSVESREGPLPSFQVRFGFFPRTTRRPLLHICLTGRAVLTSNGFPTRNRPF